MGALHRQGAQPHSGCPSPGALHHLCHACRGDVEPVPAQQFSCLRAGECQVGVADLGDIARNPVAVQRHQRVGPARQHQTQPAVGVRQDEVELLGDTVGRRTVALIDHEDHRVGAGCQSRGNADQERTVHAVTRPRHAYLGRQRSAGPPQRLQHVCPEHFRGVPRFRRQPGDIPARGRGTGPSTDEHGFARAGRTADQGEWPPDSRCHPSGERRPTDKDPGTLRYCASGLQHRITGGGASVPWKSEGMGCGRIVHQRNHGMCG